MFPRRKQTVFTVLVVVALTLGMMACDRVSRLTSKKPQYFEHTVRYQGETLGLIAKWYTGETSNWSIIASKNPDVSPNSLRIGALILIPAEIVVSTEPMPRSFVPSAPSKVKRAPAGKPGVSKRVDRDLTGSEEAEAAELPDKSASPPASGTTPGATPTPSQRQGDGLELFGPKE